MSSIPGFSRLLFLSACLIASAGRSNADALDDLIEGVRSGRSPSVTPSAVVAASQASGGQKQFDDAIVNLYLQEIKMSILDDSSQGGWPYRSFLLDRFLDEDRVVFFRKRLLNGLKGRFDAGPDGLVAYALVCPALYDGDEKLVRRSEAYLKDKDPFLYRLEQREVLRWWRPQIQTSLAREAASFAAIRDARFRHLTDLTVKYGHDIKLHPAISTALGLSASGGGVTLRQLVLTINEPNPVTHYYMRTNDGGFLVAVVSGGSTRAYLANAKEEVVRAVALASNSAPVAIPSADAQAALGAELDFWLDAATRY